MPFQMHRSPQQNSDITVLTLSGTMTMGTQLREFEWSIEELIKSSANRIAVDMSQVSYVDSSAIGVLVGCNTLAKGSGGQLRLAGITDRVAKILRLCGVDVILLRDPTLDDSISALSLIA